MRRRWSRPGTRGASAWLLLLIALALCALPAPAAAAPDLFWQLPEDGQPGGGAGQFNFPGAIAADPGTGHVFVADRNNSRIVELTVWGEFVKTWGWGVVASGPGNEAPIDERQELTVDASAGTYRLAYYNVYRGGDESRQITVPIGFNWPAADPGTAAIDSVEEALGDLTSIEPFPGAVNVTGGPGGPGGTAPYEIEFSGQLGDKDIPPLEAITTKENEADPEGPPIPTITGTVTVATLQRGGSYEICVPAEGDVCQAGQGGGAAPGELTRPNGGIALDAAANVYVYETLLTSQGEGLSYRVQKFSPAGEFLATWGGDVNKTKVAEGASEAERNLCTKAQVEAGDLCGTGVPGPGQGQFKAPVAFGPKIAVGPEGSVFVGDIERIQKFTPAGAFAAEIAVPGEVIQTLAMDGAGNFYAGFAGKDDARKLVPAGAGVSETMSFPATFPAGIALAGSGDVYLIDTLFPPKVVAYEPDGTPLITAAEGFAQSGRTLGGLATSEACGIPGLDVYVSDIGGLLNSYGPAPLEVEECPPPSLPPTIGKQFVREVGTATATLAATINPQFWNDTRYYVEYGSGECAAGGCPSQQPLPPGELLTSQVVKQQLASKDIALSGLAPGTTYHYRFVAQSSGGGPVFGIDPDGSGPEEASFAAGLEGTFRTPNVTPPPPPCPNDAFRPGAGARLPDCRAYEMVSPVDKENGDIIVLNKVATVPLALNQSSLEGNKLTYSSYRAFGDGVSAPLSSTYMATRSEGGWSTHGISPPRGRPLWEIADSVEVQYKAFSEDLCGSWLVTETDLPLAATAPAGYANVYHRDNCGAGEGTYTPAIGTAPSELEPSRFKPEVQGASGDGSRVIFQARGKLTEDALPCAVPGDPVSCKFQLYQTLPGGGLDYVCMLPGEVPAPNGCAAGSASGGNKNDGRDHMVNNAISEDGSRIFFSDAPAFRGEIYVRIEGTLTLKVSEQAEAESGLSTAQYWTAAADGSRAIFTAGGASELTSGTADLYEFRLDGSQTEKIAGDVYGLLGASEDAKRIYLVSREDRDEGGPAAAGEPNLYLYEAGEPDSFTYIGRLGEDEAHAGDGLSPTSLVPRHHMSQVSADGDHAVFMSTAPLTGFDNTDAVSGEPDAEVFRYDAAAAELSCVSCNPTGALPRGRAVGGGADPLWAAARLPIVQTMVYPSPKVMSADGARVYFESFDALLGADTNGKADVYQWQAPGSGPAPVTCTADSPSFSSAAEGCVELISTGTSEEDSSLVDVSASGNDVFFATAQSLVPQDPGLVDIYDARVGGGFPLPPLPGPFCEGAECQSPPPPPPPGATPGSSTFVGPGNAVVKPKPRKCRKGKRAVKVKGKVRCVKAKQNRKGGKSRKAKANRSRRAGR